MVDQPDGTEDGTRAREGESLFDEAMRHRAATLALIVCIVGGAVLGGLYLPDSIGPVRRVVGGGLMGGMSWLLVMVGRIIGG